MARNKYTVKDIAKLAGVSPATVSRVVNHRELVDDETAARVDAAVKELGYIVKTTHSQAATGKDLILVCGVSGGNPFYEKIIAGALTSASAHNYNLIENFDPISTATIADLIALVKKVHISGIITLGQVREDILEQLYDVIPVIQCSEYNPECKVPYVGIDDYAAARQAVSYLVHSGRNKVAMVNGPLQYKYARERLRAFRDVMEEAELFVPSSWILQVPEVDYEMAYTMVSQLLTSQSRPNAFFAVSDVFAAAIINAARKAGLRVPEDVMVMGFDNIPICEMMRPAITTVNQPQFQMGYTACEYLIDNIQSKKMTPRSILLSTNLIIRESTT